MAYAKICMMKFCPETSAARIDDGEKRLDVCRKHLRVAEIVYQDQIEVTAIYDKELRNERFEH